MLEAEILEALYELKKPSGLAEIVKKLPWVNITHETVRRYLLEFAKHGLVKIVEVNGVPTYELTAHGFNMVTYIIKHMDEFGNVRWEEIAYNAYLSELINLALKLRIIEIKRGLLSIVTKGCGDVPTNYFVAGIITPENQFVPVLLPEPPPLITSPNYGTLVHVGGGVYVPKYMVRKSLWDYLPLIILSVLGLAAIAFCVWGEKK
jgi:predicted transcriptional regulator